MPEEKKESEPIPIQAGGPDAQRPPAEGRGVDVTQTVKIKLAGKEFEVAPELASAYENREQEFSRKLSEHSGELGQLRKYKQDVEAATSSPRQTAQGPDLNVLWYTNPQEAAKVVEERVSQRLRSEYLQAEQIKSFWDGFYREHKDLSEDDFVVKAVFSNKFAELSPLSIRDAQLKLADYTREELLRIARRLKGDKNEKANRSGDLEEASGERLPKPSPEELEEAKAPQSMSALIAQRRQARRQPGAKK